MHKNILVLFSVLMLLFSAGAYAVPDDDDDDDVNEVEESVEGLMTLYLAFAVPEACAQTYPDLRKQVDAFRMKHAMQISGGKAGASDAVLPGDQQKEIAECIRKQAVLSKGQCSRFTELFSSSMQEAEARRFTEEQARKMYVEQQTLLKKGRQMLAGCADQKEKQLRQKFR